MKNIFLSLVLTCLSFSASAKVDLNSDQNKRCEQNENNSKTILLLVKENSSLKDQVEKLKTDYARLELEYQSKSKQFDPRTTSAACAKLNSSDKSKACYDNAKEKGISPDLINVCMNFVRNEERINCIDVAFNAGTTAPQLNECLQAGNTNYILSCAKVAGERNLEPKAIQSCMTNNTSKMFLNPRWECVNNLP